MKYFYILAHTAEDPDRVRSYTVPARTLQHAYERFSDFQRGYSIGVGVTSKWIINEISTKPRRGFAYDLMF